MTQIAAQPTGPRSRWRRWWLVIPVAVLLVAGIGLVRVVSVLTSPEPFAGHTGFVLSVATGELDGTPVVVSGGRDRTIGVWNLATGEPIRAPVDVGVTITDVLVTELAGTPVIVSGSFDREIRTWDLATGEPIGEPIGDDELRLSLVGVTSVTGAPTVVALVRAETDQVRLWDLATGQPVGEQIGEEAGGRLVSPTVGRVRGEEVVAALDDGGTVRVWDLATGEQVSEPLHTGDTGTQADLQLGDRSGTPVVVTGSSAYRDTTISVWNLDTGERIGTPVHSRAFLSALEVGQLDSGPVIVAGHTDESYLDDTSIWVWDLASGAQVTDPFGDTTFWPWQESVGFSDLAVADLDGIPVVVSGGYDNKIRVWDLGTGDLLVGVEGRPWAR